MKRSFILAHPTARQRALQAVQNAPDGYAVTVGEPSRNLEQNAMLWVLLTHLARTKDWAVLIDGKWALGKMSEDDWKDTLTAGFERENQRMARAADGVGLVMLGARTSQYGKRKFSNFIEFIYAWAAENEVVFPEREAVEA